MPVPAKRRPSSSKHRRASHFALKKTTLMLCPRCKKTKLPHQVCKFCGYYKDEEVLKSKLDKKEQRRLSKVKEKAA